MLSPLRSGLLLLALAFALQAPATLAQPTPSSKQQADFDHIQQSLSALSDALTRIGEEKGRQSFATAMNKTAQQHLNKAQLLLKTGHHNEARAELDNAMVAVKTAIATLRNRETLIRSLNFDNPADEYQYELDRFHTYSMLINLLLERMQPDPDKRASMEKLMKQAWEKETAARTQAAANDYSTAIKIQEDSNKLLLQAIRRGGIYVPG